MTELKPDEREEAWRGKESPPCELADEIEAAASRVIRLAGVEPMEIVTVTCSAANRDLLVRALRRYGRITLTATRADH